MFSRIAHVCLTVKDLERSVAFYERLGLSVRFRFTRKGENFGAYVQIAEGNFVELFEDKAAESIRPNDTRHFCLETQDIDAVTTQLAQRGVAFTPKKLGCDNTWQIWLEDPDGNRFEVHQYTPQSTQKNGGTIEADW
jgi:lactoylglutathione lyase/glyoxylase I family protein